MRLRSLAVATCVVIAGCVSSSRSCRLVDVDKGWRSYEAGRVDEAYALFSRAVKLCPSYQDGQLGLGFAALRRGELDLAERMFNKVLAKQPETVDALVGSGIVSWKRSRVDDARKWFEKAVQLDANHPEALAYLARFPASKAVNRPPLVLPDSLEFPARIAGAGFQIRVAGVWQPFYVKGVNIGAAIPGYNPSEFPDSATYATWLRLIGAMGANTVRVYTVHPPHFYQALLDYNRAHAAAPLWLLHGVWAEPPPKETEYDDPTWKAAFYQELKTVVDIIHGRADVALRPGHAGGHFTADVAAWTLGYILGREWEALSVVGYNRSAPNVAAWSGKYVEVTNATAMDVWLARAIETIVGYEEDTYRAQRPVAYTNWPPTDPLRHSSAADLSEEQRIRKRAGDPTQYRTAIGGDDAVSIDPTLIKSKPTLRAGYFASYHVYPYDPDFMLLEPELNRASSSFGPSNYYGYLLQLKRHHAELPVLVAEYGVPASIGNAHVQPQGWHHGGLTEARQAQVGARLTHEIAQAGMAGGIVFEWIDEWFKKTWNTEPFESPRERDRLWYNRMDAEEHYGMLAAEPLNPEGWARAGLLFRTPEGITLRAIGDEAYLRLRVEFGTAEPEELMIGMNVLGERRGELRWPDAPESALPIGLEFVLRATRDYARILAHQPANPVRLIPPDFTPPGALTKPVIANQPPGFFQGRFLMEFRPIAPTSAATGGYEGLRVLTNRWRFGRDGTEYAAIGYDWGILPRGPLPDGLWEWQGDAFEVRIPWQLINIADPSQRRALQFKQVVEGEAFGTIGVPGIRMMVGLRTGRTVQTVPKVRNSSEVPLFTWDTWDTPRWTTRVRPSYWAIRKAWQDVGANAAAAAPTTPATGR